MCLVTCLANGLISHLIRNLAQHNGLRRGEASLDQEIEWGIGLSIWGTRLPVVPVLISKKKKKEQSDEKVKAKNRKIHHAKARLEPAATAKKISGTVKLRGTFGRSFFGISRPMFRFG